MKKQMFETIQANIDTVRANNLPFSIALDIATTKEMKHNYLGIIVFYLNSDLKTQCFALDMFALKI